MNGDMIVPEIPPFKLYKMKIGHGTDKTRVVMEVLSIKCATDKACLLKEYYSQLVSPVCYEKQISIFVPTRAVHLLGTANYAKLICNNNSFLQNIIMIPIGDMQHTTLNIPFSLNSDNDIDQLTIHNLTCDQPWCYSVERIKIQNKILLVSNKQNLEQARKWVDKMLPATHSQHINNKLDITTLRQMTPRCLDKPILMAASTAYAKTLQQCTTTVNTTAESPKQFTKPLQARKV